MDYVEWRSHYSIAKSGYKKSPEDWRNVYFELKKIGENMGYIEARSIDKENDYKNTGPTGPTGPTGTGITHNFSTEIEVQERNKSLIQKLMAAPPEDKIPMRKIAFDDTEDPFGLFDIEDTYERTISGLINACEVLFSKLATNQKGQLLKDYRANSGSIRNKIRTNSGIDGYEFVLKRKRDANGRLTFTFKRADEPVNGGSGFMLTQKSNGTVLLKNLDSASTPVDDDKAYFNLIYRAGNLLSAFFESHAQELPILINQKPIHISRIKEAGKKASLFGRLLTKPVRANYGNGDIEGPKVVGGALAILMVLGLITIGDNFIFNSSERSREVFDKQELHLPDVQLISADGKPHQPEIALPNLPIQDWTPSIVMGTTDWQNAKGVRSMMGPGAARNDLTYDDFNSDGCATSPIDIGSAQKLRIVTSSAKLKDNTNFTLTNTGDKNLKQLKMCVNDNFESEKDQLWIEAV